MDEIPTTPEEYKAWLEAEKLRIGVASVPASGSVSDTPRTDAEFGGDIYTEHEDQCVDFARQLERELRVGQEDRDRLRTKLAAARLIICQLPDECAGRKIGSDAARWMDSLNDTEDGG